jgi:hypothetical protein
MQDFKVVLGIYLSSCVPSGNRQLPGQQEQDRYDCLERVKKTSANM